MSSQAAMRTAIEEIRRGEELMNVLQSHLQLHTKATDLSQGVIQSLSAALSILKSREITNGKASGSQKEAISGKKRWPLAASAETNHSERDQKKRKDVNPNSWTVVTPAPYLDGHQWRKYGQKINKQKSKYPRSYYRCTHSGDQGCPATKIVQEEECGTYSAMFKVVYSNKHTCNTSMSDGVGQTVLASPPTPSGFFIFESKKSYFSFQNLTKKEEIFSPSPINKDSNGEKLSLHNKSCSSLINNSTLSDLKTKAKGEDDVSSAPMIKDFPKSPTGLLDYYDFDFGDVASILSSLDQ